MTSPMSPCRLTKNVTVIAVLLNDVKSLDKSLFYET